MGWEYCRKDCRYIKGGQLNLIEKEYRFIQCANCGESILIDFPLVGIMVCYDCMVKSFFPHLKGLMGERIEAPGQTTTNYMV